MENIDPSIITKYNLQELNVVLTRCDIFPTFNIEEKTNIDADKMEMYKLKYNLKEFKIELRRCDALPDNTPLYS